MPRPTKASSISPANESPAATKMIGQFWPPPWTEDTDFFGCGVATWTTDRVELYLADVSEREQ